MSDENSIRWATGLTGFFLGIIVMVFYMWAHPVTVTAWEDNDGVTYGQHDQFFPYPTTDEGEFTYYCVVGGGVVVYHHDDKGHTNLIECDGGDNDGRMFPVSTTWPKARTHK